MTQTDTATLTAGSGEHAKSVTVSSEQLDRLAYEVLGMRVPGDEAFGEEDFLPAPDMERVAERLMGRDLRFSHLSQMGLTFLWKRKGGKRSGKGVYGKCQKPSGLLKFFASTDGIIWLAVDHCRELGFDQQQLEALLFHELCHASFEEDEETGERKFALAAHDFEGFRAEVEKYGLWDTTLQDLGESFKQLKLI
jgi:hypothetical protein